ncbi:MAG: four helix bundle protein [Prevotella sp.]|nr:four helix bundle protein [Prevotella sp.]
MAQSEELPIFRAAYDLLEKLIDLQKDLPKILRYNVATRMVDLCLDVLGYVYRANMSQQHRVENIENLLVSYRQLLMLLRVVYRQKAISSGRYAELIKLLDSIGKQATGWKYNEQKRKEDGTE